MPVRRTDFSMLLPVTNLFKRGEANFQRLGSNLPKAWQPPAYSLEVTGCLAGKYVRTAINVAYRQPTYPSFLRSSEVLPVSFRKIVLAGISGKKMKCVVKHISYYVVVL